MAAWVAAVVAEALALMGIWFLYRSTRTARRRKRTDDPYYG